MEGTMLRAVLALVFGAFVVVSAVGMYTGASRQPQLHLNIPTRNAIYNLHIDLVFPTDAASALVAPGTQFHSRIVGGSSVLIEHFPWQVSMTYFRNHRCGGSIISAQFVLTAAHCTYRATRSAIGIRAGTSYRNSGGVQTLVKDVVEHPEYTSRSNDFDISIIRLANSLPFGPTIQPIAMASENSVLAPGSSVVISGWGDTTETKESAAYFLQYVSVPIVDSHVCVAAYQRHAAINSNMICAGFNGIGGKDACQGDSGGPMVYGKTLHGVVSFGIGCARPNYPGVYSKVAAYRPWIDEVMRRY